MVDRELQGKVRPLYATLRGFMSKVLIGSGIWNMQGKHTAEIVNDIVEQLTNIDGDAEYTKLKIDVITRNTDDYRHVDKDQYSSNLMGLTMRIWGKYYYEEEAEPFSGNPNSVTYQTQNQNQSQSVSVNMLLNLQDYLTSKLSDPLYSSKSEQSFLETVKSRLSQVKGLGDFINLVLVTAQTYGMTIEKIGQIFRDLRI